MRKSAFLSFALALLLPAAASAQRVDSITVGYSPRTGDAWVDTRLGDINVYARGDLRGFVDEVSVSYGAPHYFVEQMVYERRWAPGDIEYACLLARLAKLPCQEVVARYDRNRGQGWGVIAQQLGITPGSAAFHALKGDLDKSHGRLKAKAQGRGNSNSNQGQGNSPGKGKGKKGGG